jgi:hypothetical protein
LLLPRPLGLAETADALAACSLTSIALKEVNLEHVYLEATAATSPRPAA